MRTSFGLAGLLLALWVVSAAQAQQFNTSQGPNPVSSMVNPTFSPSNVSAPMPGTQKIYNGPSGLFNWLPKIELFNSTSQINTSVFPKDKDMPGMKYLSNFGFRYGKPAK